MKMIEEGRRFLNSCRRWGEPRAVRGLFLSILACGVLGASPAPQYDPKHFDGTKMIREAIRMANEAGQTDDFGIFIFHVPNVGPDGLADLTLGDGTLAYYELHSPKLNKLPPGIPRGADVEPKCYSRVDFPAEPEHASVQDPSTDSDCPKPNPPPPKCALAQIWQRAIAKGAPRDAVARLSYGWEFFDGKVPEWDFRIGDDLILNFPDNCK